MLDQALDAAEALCEGEEVAAFEETFRGAEPAFQHRGDHAAITLVHLLRRKQMLRMAGEAWIDHALDLRVLVEPRRDMHGIAAVPLHAQRQRLDAAQGEEGVER